MTLLVSLVRLRSQIVLAGQGCPVSKMVLVEQGLWPGSLQVYQSVISINRETCLSLCHLLVKI